jgi:hypothetical protein
VTVWWWWCGTQVEGRPQLRAGTFEEIVKWIIFNNVNEHVSSFLITFRAYGAYLSASFSLTFFFSSFSLLSYNLLF